MFDFPTKLFASTDKVPQLNGVCSEDTKFEAVFRKSALPSTLVHTRDQLPALSASRMVCRPFVRPVLTIQTHFAQDFRRLWLKTASEAASASATQIRF